MGRWFDRFANPYDWREFDYASAEVNKSADIAAGPTISGVTIGIINTSPTWAGSGTGTGQQADGGFWRQGRSIQVILRGVATTGATPGTLTFDWRLDTTGGASLGASPAITLLASQTNAVWKFEGDITCRSVGTAGTLWGQGDLTFATALVTAGLGMAPASAPTTATIDTTANHVIVVCVTLSQAGSSFTTQQAYWRVRN
jgi:hypothetical protein